MAGWVLSERRLRRIGLLALIAAIALAAVSAPAAACALRKLERVPAPPRATSLHSEPDGAPCVSRPAPPFVKASALLLPAQHPAVLTEYGPRIASPEIVLMAARPASGLPLSRSAAKPVLRI